MLYNWTRSNKTGKIFESKDICSKCKSKQKTHDKHTNKTGLKQVSGKRLEKECRGLKNDSAHCARKKIKITIMQSKFSCSVSVWGWRGRFTILGHARMDKAKNICTMKLLLGYFVK